MFRLFSQTEILYCRKVDFTSVHLFVSIGGFVNYKPVITEPSLDDEKLLEKIEFCYNKYNKNRLIYIPYNSITAIEEFHTPDIQLVRLKELSEK